MIEFHNIKELYGDVEREDLFIEKIEKKGVLKFYQKRTLLFKLKQRLIRWLLSKLEY